MSDHSSTLTYVKMLEWWHETVPNCTPAVWNLLSSSRDQVLRTRQMQMVLRSYRVTTNLENLEYSRISTNIENSGNSVQPQRKFLTNKIVSVRSNVCVTQQGLVNFGDGHWSQCVCIGDLSYCWSWCGMTLDIWRPLLHLLFVVITYGKV